MENKEDYVGYEDQELCNRYYKEAEAMRQKQDWFRLRAVPAPFQGNAIARLGSAWTWK